MTESRWPHMCVVPAWFFATRPSKRSKWMREDYKTSSPLKPAELLKRVLDDLHPRGLLGFVLPRRFLAGSGYATVRRLLAERFAKIELTLLPDRVFEADPEVVLLIATDPIPHYTCRVSNRRVNDDVASWRRFELSDEVSSEASENLDLDQAAKSFQIPELTNVWCHLINSPRSGMSACFIVASSGTSHLPTMARKQVIAVPLCD